MQLLKHILLISYNKYDHVLISLCHAGTAPNIARNAIVNCTELVTYDFIKDTLLKSTPLTGKTMIQRHDIMPHYLSLEQ